MLSTVSTVSSADRVFLSHAATEANKSTLLSQHGCIAVANGKILGRGHNTLRTQSQDGFICNTCSCHAEIAALRNLYHTHTTIRGARYDDQIKVTQERPAV